MAVLGLNEPGDADWGRLRGLQYSSLSNVTKLRVLAHAVAAVGVARLFYDVVSIFVVLAWMVALGVSLFYSARIDQSLADADRLIGEAADSPITERGSADQFGIMFGITRQISLDF